MSEPSNADQTLELGGPSEFNQSHELNEPVDFAVDDFPGGLDACLEAVLMAADQPQPSEDLARILGVGQEQVESSLEAIAARLGKDQHGFCLRHTARGWLFASDPAYREVVAAFVTDAQSAHLSQAALEALAIVAYRQPITRAQVAGIRGVNSDGVLRSLLVRGLVREEGLDPETRAALLVTTSLFLEKMGIDAVDQLPSLAPFLPEEGSAVKEMTERFSGGHSPVSKTEEAGL